MLPNIDLNRPRLQPIPAIFPAIPKKVRMLIRGNQAEGDQEFFAGNIGGPSVLEQITKEIGAATG